MNNINLRLLLIIIVYTTFTFPFARNVKAETFSDCIAISSSPPPQIFTFDQLSFSLINGESYLAIANDASGFKPQIGDRIIFLKNGNRMVEGEYIGVSKKGRIAVFKYNTSFFCTTAPSSLENNTFPPMLTESVQNAVRNGSTTATKSTPMRSSKTKSKTAGNHCIPLRSLANNSLSVELHKRPTKISLEILPTMTVKIELKQPKTAMEFAEAIGAVKNHSGQSIEFKTQQRIALQTLTNKVNDERQRRGIAQRQELKYSPGFAEYAISSIWIENIKTVSNNSDIVTNCKFVLCQAQTAIVWNNNATSSQDRAIAQDYLTRLRGRHELVHLKLGRWITEDAVSKLSRRQLTSEDLRAGVKCLTSAIAQANKELDDETNHGEREVDFYFSLIDNKTASISHKSVGYFFP
ncbi:MAG: hypothetical protein RLY14_874 [Planctomycetota bacterium]|jgi:hypothetical protein